MMMIVVVVVVSFAVQEPKVGGRVQMIGEGEEEEEEESQGAESRPILASFYWFCPQVT